MDAQSVATPSTYHQCVKYSVQGAQGTITANNDPFSNIEAYHAEARFSKAKGKGKADDENTQSQSQLGIHLQDLLDQ